MKIIQISSTPRHVVGLGDDGIVYKQKLIGGDIYYWEKYILDVTTDDTGEERLIKKEGESWIEFVKFYINKKKR